jgi:hypothetical protein
MPFIKACRAVQEKFGTDVVYTPEAGQAVPFRGVFETSFEEVDVETGVSVQSDQPRLSSVILADIPGGLERGARLTVKGETYRLRDKPHVDEDGICDLYLHRV